MAITAGVPTVSNIKNVKIDLQNGTENTLYTTWSWTQYSTDHYECKWYYSTGDGVWFVGSSEDVTVKQSIYNVPSNAKKVKFKVKPIAKTYKYNDDDKYHWLSSWSTEVFYDMTVKATPAKAGTVAGLKLKIQTGTTRSLYGTWTWTKDHTDHYRVQWSYHTGDTIWYQGNGDGEDLTTKYATYDVPDLAKTVRFRVKPVAKTHTVNGKETKWWTGDWSSWFIYDMTSINNKPAIPDAPDVSISEKYKLTAEVDISDTNTDQVYFQVVKNQKSVFTTGIAKVVKSHASFTCDVTAGAEYEVRCKGQAALPYGIKGHGLLESDWSEYSDNVGTIPAAPSEISKWKALSSTSVYLEWATVKNTTEYVIEYTKEKRFFNSNSNEVSSVTVPSTVHHAEITGLDTGTTWFFRLAASNGQGQSAWCTPVSLILGKKPSPPTTWSSTTTAVVGKPVLLYWVHNSEDGSSQTNAWLEIIVDGETTTEYVKNTTDEFEKDQTSCYNLSTSNYAEGAVVQWRVRTQGVMDEYGDWSVMRTINVYAPPTLELGFTDVMGDDGEPGMLIDTMYSFPVYISGTAGPSRQTPVAYNVTITSNSNYEDVDETGKSVQIAIGQVIYSKFILPESRDLLITLGPGDINLANNATYTLSCTVAMDSGLTAQAEVMFDVEWEDISYAPDAEISIDSDTVAAYIRPYCEDEDGNLIDNISLSVYRREYNGEYTEIASGLQNQNGTFVTDPHPALDYARYRIVAISNETGAVSFYDMPGYPVQEKSVIIQWDEDWSNFETSNEDALSEPTWAGSMLRLSYNIDVSDSNSIDATLVKYIGRKRPVSYYGTQLGESASWSVEIPKDDEETLYALRRLAIFMGDVYVREPSGSGYWAQIAVSFSQKHKEITIPVSISLTRVDGGI